MGDADTKKNVQDQLRGKAHRLWRLLLHQSPSPLLSRHALGHVQAQSWEE